MELHGRDLIGSGTALNRKAEEEHGQDKQWDSRAMNSFAAAMNSDEMRRQSLAEKGLEQLGKSRAKTGAAED